MSARVIQVIETDFEKRGKGTVADPVRRVRQYWDLKGNLLAEVDPVVKARSADELRKEWKREMEHPFS